MNNHKSLILTHLLTGASITQAEFIGMTSLSARLAPRIKDLRDDGYPIINVTLGQRDTQGNSLPARYLLPSDFLRLVRHHGVQGAMSKYQE